MSEEFTFVQVPTWQRTLVVIIYLLLTIVGLWGLAWVVTSSDCNANRGCGKIDQVIYAVMGVFDFIFAFIWGILGLKGLLPGAKRKMVAVNK